MTFDGLTQLSTVALIQRHQMLELLDDETGPVNQELADIETILIARDEIDALVQEA